MALHKNHHANVVVIGGGTGTHTVLKGLKLYDWLNLTAIVSMADNGGSTGILRDELGVLPPGDIRQCLVALSESDQLMRDLFNYRFGTGQLKGHNFGNLFLSALEKVTSSFDQAVSKTSEVLKIKGRVVPVTLESTHLYGVLKNGKVLNGEHAVTTANLRGHDQINRVFLKPRVQASAKALAAIREANLIVVAPGTLYSSIIPIFLVNGIAKAIHNSKAKKIVVCNLMAKGIFTRGFSVDDFLKALEKYAGQNTFDYVIYNKRLPRSNLLKRYQHEGMPVAPPLFVKNKSRTFTKVKDKLRPIFIGGDLVARDPYRPNLNDPLKRQRTLIRHNPERLAKIIVDIIKREKRGYPR